MNTAHDLPKDKGYASIYYQITKYAAATVMLHVLASPTLCKQKANIRET